MRRSHFQHCFWTPQNSNHQWPEEGSPLETVMALVVTWLILSASPVRTSASSLHAEVSQQRGSVHSTFWRQYGCQAVLCRLAMGTTNVQCFLGGGASVVEWSWLSLKPPAMRAGCVPLSTHGESQLNLRTANKCSHMPSSSTCSLPAAVQCWRSWCEWVLLQAEHPTVHKHRARYESVITSPRASCRVPILS